MDDVCYECSGYGDDYYTDENGELICVCDDCPYNNFMNEGDEYGETTSNN